MTTNLNDIWYLITNKKEISNLILDRKNQIGEQHNIDVLLRLKCYECPQTINDLFMIEREQNCESSQSFLCSPGIESYMDSIKNNSKRIEKHQKMLMNILSDNNPENNTCEVLENYVKRLKEN